MYTIITLTRNRSVSRRVWKHFTNFNCAHKLVFNWIFSLVPYHDSGIRCAIRLFRWYIIFTTMAPITNIHEMNIAWCWIQPVSTWTNGSIVCSSTIRSVTFTIDRNCVVFLSFFFVINFSPIDSSQSNQADLGQMNRMVGKHKMVSHTTFDSESTWV